MVMFCSCVESYLQSTYWPSESNEDLEEPVKKKPRRTQVCNVVIVSILLDGHF